MIQRVQSIYLLLAAALLIAMLFVPVSGEVTPLGILGYGLVLIVAAVFAIATIFLYKERRRQMRFATLNILLVIISYPIYFIYKQNCPSLADDHELSLPLIISLVVIFLLALAIRGIRKDEKLVRSLDRIR